MGIVSISNDNRSVQYNIHCIAQFASRSIRFIAGSDDNEIRNRAAAAPPLPRPHLILSVGKCLYAAIVSYTSLTLSIAMRRINNWHWQSKTELTWKHLCIRSSLAYGMARRIFRLIHCSHKCLEPWFCFWPHAVAAVPTETGPIHLYRRTYFTITC